LRTSWLIVGTVRTTPVTRASIGARELHQTHDSRAHDCSTRAIG